MLCQDHEHYRRFVDYIDANPCNAYLNLEDPENANIELLYFTNKERRWLLELDSRIPEQFSTCSAFELWMQRIVNQASLAQDCKSVKFFFRVFTWNTPEEGFKQFISYPCAVAREHLRDAFI